MIRSRTTALLLTAVLGALLVPAPAQAETRQDALDEGSRAAVRAAWNDVAEAALRVPTGWTGSVAGCVAGAPSPAAQQATLDVLNLYRDLTGLRRVTLDPALSAQAQETALMMEAQGRLSHSPDASWACHTAVGAATAGRSNLYLGPGSGAAAVVGYLDDPGSSNTAAGHRRWLLDPGQVVVGSGQTARGNAMQVFAPQQTDPQAPAFVPWPSAGYLPVQAEPEGRWSLSADGADFRAATVTVTAEDGTALPLVQHPVRDGYGPNTLVWDVQTGHATDDPDRSYTAEVRGIRLGGQEVTRTWTTRLFDARQDGPQLAVPAPVTTVGGSPATAPVPAGQDALATKTPAATDPLRPALPTDPATAVPVDLPTSEPTSQPVVSSRLSARAARVPAGAPVAVAVRALQDGAGAVGLPVVLQQRTRTGWTVLRSGSSGPAGLVGWTLRPRAGAQYRPVVGGVAGTPVRIDVVQRVASSAARQSVRGTVAPAGTAVVALQRRTGGGWSTVARARTSADGRYLLTHRVPRGSVVRVVALARPDLLQGASAATRVP